MLLIVVYVGAVAVLFLFVVMMLDVDFAEFRQGFLQYLPIGALIGLIFAVELLVVVGAWVIDPQIVRAPVAPIPGELSNTAALGQVLYTQYVYYFQAAGPRAAGRDDRRHRADAARAARRQAPGHRPAERPHQGHRDGGPQGRLACRRSRGDGLMIGLGHYLAVAAILFTLGVLGIFLNRKNVIVILMSVELILLSVNLNFVAFSSFLNDIVGQVFALLVLTVAAAEAAIGLAILVVYFRNRGTIAVEDINMMKG